LDGENVNPNDVTNPETKMEDSDYFQMSDGVSENSDEDYMPELEEVRP
jgi:hypothetical protein